MKFIIYSLTKSTMVNLNSITQATRESLGFSTKNEFLSFMRDHNKTGRDFSSEEELVKFVKKKTNSSSKKENVKSKTPSPEPPPPPEPQQPALPPTPNISPIEARINKKYPKDVQDYISEIIENYMKENPHPPINPMNSWDKKMLLTMKRCAKKEINPIFNLILIHNQHHRFSDDIGGWAERLYYQITWNHEFPLDDFSYPLYVLDSSTITPKMKMIADFEETGKYPGDAAWGMANVIFTHIKDSKEPKEITFSTFLVDENTGKREEKRTFKAVRSLRNPVIEAIGKYKIAVKLVK